MKKNIILWAALLFLTSACSIYHIDSEETTTNFYPSKSSPDQVKYVENVYQPYEVIGTVTVNAERSRAMNEVIEKLKKEAAILGGDAITDVKTNASGTWKKLPPQKFLGNAYIRANTTATVVVFTGKDVKSTF